MPIAQLRSGRHHAIAMPSPPAPHWLLKSHLPTTPTLLSGFTPASLIHRTIDVSDPPTGSERKEDFGLHHSKTLSLIGATDPPTVERR